MTRIMPYDTNIKKLPPTNVNLQNDIQISYPSEDLDSSQANP